MEGEVMLGIPAEKAWEMYRDNDIINKINPEMLTSAEYIEGDGRPGSLRLFKLGPPRQNPPLVCFGVYFVLLNQVILDLRL
ncbi:uncharacterized protein Pyn_16964 [Prunus yedoensis var. nudiflora]|uniref:Uncharacterized protein n=1 Tax=Prunus yedoensis var. nudiflora TaxID=2094558 RepID=A0A314ZLK5_PRUYE|nr:uncharacterized protein Pyn_16964 [Prunus yedoensis var. nudiflora]